MKSSTQKFTYGVIFAIIVSACNLDQYNNSDLKKIRDWREGDVYVYGVKGDSARQLRQQYPDDPNAAQRAKAIREKFFKVSESSSNLQDGVTSNNTTQPDGKKPQPEKKS